MNYGKYRRNVRLEEQNGQELQQRSSRGQGLGKRLVKMTQTTEHNETDWKLSTVTKGRKCGSLE